MDGETTVLTRATSKSESLRTTVPAGIARQFRLKEGDQLEWVIESRKNKLVIIVTPISNGKEGGGVQ
jgi:bifunctional DNA-binding transcriptional regulator/antitoxin component of YhaV-PrlF toxin-antitoxin module